MQFNDIRAQTAPRVVGKREDEGMTSYQNIQVELPRELDVALYNIISHAKGQVVQVQVRNPLEPGPRGGKLEINPELTRFTMTVGGATAGLESALPN